MENFNSKLEKNLSYIPMDKRFLNYTIQKHLELRNYTIDLLEGK